MVTIKLTCVSEIRIKRYEKSLLGNIFDIQEIFGKSLENPINIDMNND